MLHSKNLPYHLWAEATNTTCHIHNRVTIRFGAKSILYELWKGRNPNVKHFHVFGSKCYFLADRKQRRKMDDDAIITCYSYSYGVETNLIKEVQLVTSSRFLVHQSHGVLENNQTLHHLHVK